MSDDAIVSKDLTGTITSWNPAAERMFGYTAGEVIGRSIRIIIPESRQGEEDHVLRRIDRGEKVDHFETVRRRKDGSEICVSLTVSPIRDDRGTVIGASNNARDITSRKRESERAAFFADMGSILSSTLDNEVTLRTIARLVTIGRADGTRPFADYAIVDMQEPARRCAASPPRIAIRKRSVSSTRRAATPRTRRQACWRARCAPDRRCSSPISAVPRSSRSAATRITEAVLAQSSQGTGISVDLCYSRSLRGNRLRVLW